MASESCFLCKTAFATQDGFSFCPSCGAPHFKGNLASPFEILGAPKAFKLDEGALETRYYDLSKRLHPDRFAAAGAAAKMKTQELAAALNQSYISLRQPESRLETLLRDAGALKETEKTVGASQLPAELAEEYFELQEAMMNDPEKAARMSADFRARLDRERQELTAKMYALAEKTNWSTPASGDIEEIVELRRKRSYIRSMIENLDRTNRL